MSNWQLSQNHSSSFNFYSIAKDWTTALKHRERHWSSTVHYYHLVIAISSLIAEPLGPIIDPDMALDIKNLIEITFLIVDSFCGMRGVRDLSEGGLEIRNNLSLLFLEILLLLLFKRKSPLSFLWAKVIESSDWFMYESIIVLLICEKISLSLVEIKCCKDLNSSVLPWSKMWNPSHCRTQPPFFDLTGVWKVQVGRISTWCIHSAVKLSSTTRFDSQKMLENVPTSLVTLLLWPLPAVLGMIRIRFRTLLCRVPRTSGVSGSAQDVDPTMWWIFDLQHSAGDEQLSWKTEVTYTAHSGK